MKYLLTFSDGKLFNNVEKLMHSTQNILNVDGHFAYRKQHMWNDREFVEKNYHLIRVKHGCGMYIWKPYIINDALKKINDGDYLLYFDCSRHYPTGFTESSDGIIKHMEENNIEMTGGMIDSINNYYHVSSVCVNIIKQDHEFDSNKFYTTPHYMATHIIIKKTENTVKCVQEWLKYCQIKDCICPPPRRDGRHNYDMSVFNIVMYIFGFKGIDVNDGKHVCKDHNYLLKYFNNKYYNDNSTCN